MSDHYYGEDGSERRLEYLHGRMVGVVGDMKEFVEDCRVENGNQLIQNYIDATEALVNAVYRGMYPPVPQKKVEPVIATAPSCLDSYSNVQRAISYAKANGYEISRDWDSIIRMAERCKED